MSESLASPKSRHGASRRIILNVGGKRFETYTATFMKYPGSLLSRMFSDENSEMVRPDEKNEYFIGSVLFFASLVVVSSGRLLTELLFHSTG
jgi:hypothetical protein